MPEALSIKHILALPRCLAMSNAVIPDSGSIKSAIPKPSRNLTARASPTKNTVNMLAAYNCQADLLKLPDGEPAVVVLSCLPVESKP